MNLQGAIGLHVSKEDYVGKIVADYKAACKAGYKAGKLEAKAPPGMEDMVMKLKDKYGEDAPEPFAIAWWKYNQGKKKN